MKIKSSLKKLLSMLALMVVVLPFAVVASCQSEKVEQTSEISENSVSLATMQSLYINCLKHPVVVSNVTSTRAVIESCETLSPIYLESPQPLLLDEPIQKENLITFNDVIALQDDLGIFISSTPSSNTIDSVFVDTKKVEKALEPMVKESKQWLYSRDMSETDIQAMLAEEGATELELVPFVLGCMDAENLQLTRSVDWEKAGECALIAIGFDFTTFLSSSGITKWKKAALKRAFKSVAKKALGPAGVAIAVIDFGLCMY